ncbi:Mitochondrial Rho GTPase 2 [Forsythia ovata]|uniref:Mitochondrial Rho GTPase 2 n=1 Tax=Forsythia ovata TaxID=205694 RepID=A0ABD1ST48_9LAMI
MSGGSIPDGRTNVRIVVVGDRATEKFSLIAAAAFETFSREAPPVLPPTRLSADFYPDNVPITIIDTLSRFEFVCVVANFTTDLCLTGLIGFGVITIHSLEYRGRLAEELKRADAVVLTYACDQRTTLNRIKP